MKEKVLDLFCGMGGLAYGFKKVGFKVTGVDISEAAGQTFEINKLGQFIRADLSKQLVDGVFDVVIGGPPCKPWSSVNVTRRGRNHLDYRLVSRFFSSVEHHSPKIFLLENVPPLKNDIILKKNIKKLEKKGGYSVRSNVIKYSNYGSPTSRRRLIVFGVKDGNAEIFFEKLPKYARPPKTVKDAIWYLRRREKGEVPDHVWPELKTIKKYLEYYDSEKFGWYILRWNKPAPSFGNIMKTYILHPDAFNGGIQRVISVREAARLMGFDRNFRFPTEIGIGAKYQMIADAVSPVFSYRVAKLIKQILSGEKE